MSTRLNPAYIAFLLILTFVMGLALLTTLQARISNYWPLGVDIYSHWVGARAFWQGTSPYTEAVQREAEQLIYGRARRADEAPFPFTYPAYLALILFPITLLPASQVGIVWGAAMWAVLATLVAAWSLALTPRPAPWIWVLLVFGALAFRPALVSIINGQYALFVVGCIFFAWWLLERGEDAWSGIPLALATIKPSVGVFLPIVMILWAVRWRRWKMLASFVVVSSLLLGLTIARIGWWLPDLVYHTITYSPFRQGIGLAWSEEQIVRPPGVIWLILALIVLALGARQLWRVQTFPWLALSGALNLNLLLTPHTIEYDLTLLLVPLLWLGWEWRHARGGLLLVGILLWIPWLSWLVVILSGGEIDVWWRGIWMFYPSLLLSLMLLWLARTRKEQTE